jgi:glycosyltransferase involved in cell wall biosynthesis
MKIALVNNNYFMLGGSERVLFDDQRALEAAGHEVRPFAHQDERNNATSSSVYFPNAASYSTASGAGLLMAAFDVVYSSVVGKAFRAFLDDFKPDVIHCHNIYGRLTTAVLDEAKRHRIPLVMTVHDLKLVCPAYLGLRQGKPCMLCQDGGYWRCLRWKCHKQSRAASLVYTVESYFNRFAGKYDSVSRFLCPSRFMQNALISSGIAAERTAYHPNALPLDQYIPQFELGEYVLYAGRLSAEKGIWTMLSAFEQAKIPLRIAGTGQLEVELCSRIHERALNVQMEGYCTGDRLAQLYSNSAFTVVPSEWYENASMSVLESFAYGKPVLAADIGGNQELVADGETGRLFPHGSVERLTATASEMWANRDETYKMGKSARQLVERRFSQEQRLSALLAIYADVGGCVPLEGLWNKSHKHETCKNGER